MSRRSTPKTPPSAPKLVQFSPSEIEDLINEAEGETEPRFVEIDSDDELSDDEDEEFTFWEELLSALFWTVPFCFLFTGLDIAIHAQFSQEYYTLPGAAKRVAFTFPVLFLLNLVFSPTARLLPRSLLQPLVLLISIYSGTSLVHVTLREGFKTSMRKSPPLGTMWVWAVVKADLSWGVAALVAVAAAEYVR